MLAKTFEFMGITRTAKTVTEAKNLAMNEAEEIIKAVYNSQPTIVKTETHNGRQYTLIVAMEAARWGYTIVPHEMTDARQYLQTGYDDSQDAVRAMYRHLAQYCHKSGEFSGLGVILFSDDEGRGQHKSWCRWQYRYAQAVHTGNGADFARQQADSGFLPESDYPEDLRK